VPFYKELGNAGTEAKDVPVRWPFSVGEEELRGVDTKPLVGHLAAWNYFMSLKNPQNDAFIKMYRDWAVQGASSAQCRQGRPPIDPMESHLHRINMWEAGGPSKAKTPTSTR